MPDFTMASAVWRIKSSLTLQPNLFQLFHPIGGVGARVAFCANNAGVRLNAMTANKTSILDFTSRIPRQALDAKSMRGARCLVSIRLQSRTGCRDNRWWRWPRRNEFPGPNWFLPGSSPDNSFG